jgi:hypothetical protein
MSVHYYYTHYQDFEIYFWLNDSIIIPTMSTSTQPPIDLLYDEPASKHKISFWKCSY